MYKDELANKAIVNPPITLAEGERDEPNTNITNP